MRNNAMEESEKRKGTEDHDRRMEIGQGVNIETTTGSLEQGKTRNIGKQE
jgi:hypothetical protein